MMLRRFLVIAVAISSVGCGATLIQSAGANGSPYAPLDDGRRTGLVKYQIDDGDYFIRRRREDAYKKMYQSCSGPYLIVAEGPRVENGRVVTTVTETTSATAAQSGTPSTSTAGSKPTTAARDTTSTVVERKTETTQAIVEEHWWYVQYRCASSADTLSG